MGGSKTDVSAYEREISRVAELHGTIRSDQDVARQKSAYDDTDSGPGLKSTFRDPSTKDGQLRWD